MQLLSVSPIYCKVRYICSLWSHINLRHAPKIMHMILIDWMDCSNRYVVIFTEFASVAASEVFMLITSSEASIANFLKRKKTKQNKIRFSVYSKEKAIYRCTTTDLIGGFFEERTCNYKRVFMEFQQGCHFISMPHRSTDWMERIIVSLGCSSWLFSSVNKHSTTIMSQ